MVGVLICEPASELRAALVRSIRAAGWRAEEAATARDALVACDEARFGAALVDVVQPGGMSLVARLAERRFGVAVLATAAGRDSALVLAARSAGASGFLRKPFGVEALESWLGRVLSTSASADDKPPELLTRDPGMLRCLALAEFAANSRATVVIVGESGTGKELLARRVHERSGVAAGPFIAVRCGVLDPAGAELFGGKHLEGAFEAARGGTLVLDEIGDVAPALQRRLLERLEPRSGDGNEEMLPRIIVTTRRALADDVEQARLLPELALRLGVIVLDLPPLRERTGDVSLLARHFARVIAEATGAAPPRLGEATLGALARMPWRGNVRELENWMRRAVMLYPDREPEMSAAGRTRSAVASGRNGHGTCADVMEAPGREKLPTLNLRELERRTILRSLEIEGGNRTRASQALGISVRTLRNKIREFGLAEQ